MNGAKHLNKTISDLTELYQTSSDNLSLKLAVRLLDHDNG